MAMRLSNVVPFGRSFDEYQKMFNLTELDLDKKIVGIGGGPASFNAEMNALGKQAVSIDPLYCFNGGEIESRFYQVVDDIIDQIKLSPSDWVWTYHRSPDDLKLARIRVLKQFVADFDFSGKENRYRVGELPVLHLEEDSFDLALCSHFLFLYSDQFDLEFHLKSVLEMLRIAKEVRIFPLLTLMQTRSPYLEPLIEGLGQASFSSTIEKVSYELQRGGNEMLVVKRH